MMPTQVALKQHYDNVQEKSQLFWAAGRAGWGSARLDGEVGVGTQRMLNSAQHTPTQIWEWQLTEYGNFSN